MPKFGSVFSNEGKGSANEGGERRSGLTADEIASRLYPKPSEAWRREESVVPAAVAEPATVTAPPEAVSELSTTTEESNSMAATESNDNTQPAVSTEATPVPMAAALDAPAKASDSGPEAPAERLVSVISRNSIFDGNYATDGDVRVEGEVRGDITCKGHVLICDGATVNAKISATSVAVAGRLSGEVTCSERFEAQPTARITSQISTPRLVIQEGAVVDGEIKMGVQA